MYECICNQSDSKVLSLDQLYSILSPLLLLGENKLYFFTVQWSIFPSSPSSALKCWWGNKHFCFLLGYVFLRQERWDIVQWTGICLMMTCRSNVQLVQLYTSGNSFQRINSIFLQNAVRQNLLMTSDFIFNVWHAVLSTLWWLVALLTSLNHILKISKTSYFALQSVN